jgi:RNA polymerase sigma-70 factor, ECF subfamily
LQFSVVPNLTAGGSCGLNEQMEMDDRAAVDRVRAGDKDAFRVLVERHSRDIFRLGFRLMGSEQEAEEVVQDTFLKAYRSLGRFESRASFGTWVYRIAMNDCYDRLARRKKEMSLDSNPIGEDDDPPPAEMVAATDPSPERQLLSAEVSSRVRKVMSELTPNERTAFVMRHFEGKSVNEIARVLDVQVGAAKNSIFRAVQKLRRELEPLRATR